MSNYYHALDLCNHLKNLNMHYIWISQAVFTSSVLSECCTVEKKGEQQGYKESCDSEK